MALNLADWSKEHIREVFEASTDELSLRAINSTFSRSLAATLNGSPLDFDMLCGLVSAMRKQTLPSTGLRVEWRHADATPDDSSNRNGNFVGEYYIRGIWRAISESEQLVEFERRKKVSARIECGFSSRDNSNSNRRIVKLDIVATDTQIQENR
ncbi:hypothetical protein R3P38DRAFT_790768 [Favolaschia claudopus]|uniref:Uncharacterized protein n=1 Tax=Favolaschia claudopus TaxID=2862362 RepID=A0AAW0C2I1_9AGAR